jgi:hypothetical protein
MGAVRKWFRLAVAALVVLAFVAAAKAQESGSRLAERAPVCNRRFWLESLCDANDWPFSRLVQSDGGRTNSNPNVPLPFRAAPYWYELVRTDLRCGGLLLT